MPEPPNTPMRPENDSGTWPASSSASQATSRKCRCCGSMIAASRGLKPKKPASKSSMSCERRAGLDVVRVAQERRVDAGARAARRR